MRITAGIQVAGRKNNAPETLVGVGFLNHPLLMTWKVNSPIVHANKDDWLANFNGAADDKPAIVAFREITMRLY